MKRLIPVLAVLPLAACGEGDSDNENELISAVMLSFAPPAGASIDVEWNDPDGDGGDPPTIGAVNLAASTTYTLTVRFQNRLGSEVLEITDEVRDEGDQHQVFFTGSAVVGPATTNTTGPLTQAYADTDVNGLPLGLTNTITSASGTGMLTVTLRHMPPEEPPEKAANTADLVKTGGFDAIGGSTDASVTFPVTIP